MEKPKAPVAPPTKCDVCSGSVKLIKNTTTFSTKQDNWPYLYKCDRCDAAVGCHPNTITPYGPLASRHVRSLRARAHFAFDPLWETGLMTRDRAYVWLAHELDIDVDDCHIALLTEAQLEKTVVLAKEYLHARRATAERRREKLNAKRIKQSQVHRDHVRRRKDRDRER